jgi:NADH:ubiquinone oxidoreductase subunit 6 (subunit J)
MDSLHAIGFYVSSGVSVAGGLGVALLPRRDMRGASLLVVAIGLAAIYLTLSAGFAAVVALVCYAGAAVVLAGPRYRSLDVVAGPVWRQLGGVAAAVLLALLAYSAFRGAFAHVTIFHGETFGPAGIGRLLFEHDTLAVEAIAALVLVALAGGAAAWRVRDRTR